MLHGFDISAYQSSTAPTGDFVFVKATEGASYASTRFDAQWATAKSRARVRGAYHFARPEQSSAQHQADRLIAMARPVPGELLCLDLEASGLSQAATNAWARLFGQRLRERAPGVRTVLYMGSGYASNGTGRGLSDSYDWWWYPQYPAAYQLTEDNGDLEQRRAANRSHLIDGRTPLAAATSRWPAAVAPWLPSGLTCGWQAPHLWQFTDNWSGLDASVTALTIDQLAGGGQQPTEEDMPYGGQLPAKANVPNGVSKANISFPKGSEGAIGFVYDSPDKAVLRVAFHHKSGHGEIFEDVEVGGPASDKDSWPAKKVITFKNKADGDWVSIVRQDDGPDPVGWDMS